MRKVYRQGDVLLLALTKLPEHPRHEWEWSTLAVEGESEGHVHRVIGPTLRLITAERPVFLIPLETVMVHPEHPTLTIPPGAYEVRQAREFGRSRGVD